MAEFLTDGKALFIDGRKVIAGWESYSGWYWFATEKVCEQLSDFGDGREVPDVIWFGLVQGFEEEWGEFSQADIMSAAPKVWKIKPCDLPSAGRRDRRRLGA